MHWWHGVHWAYWNRTELLERSLDYYSAIFEKAQRKAEIQGYEGVRWPKMTDAEGNDSPSGVGEFLIWQEPHIIYFAELCYRQHPDKETLDKYAPLIFATADFMADFARYDKENNRYILGPPLIPAQENLEKEITFNPPFELAYWKWGLTKAQEWRQRMNLPKNEVWQTVLNNLAGFAQKEGKYLAAESAPDSYQNEDYYSDHPMVLGAFGMLPGTAGLDTTVMANTFNYIAQKLELGPYLGMGLSYGSNGGNAFGQTGTGYGVVIERCKEKYIPGKRTQLSVGPFADLSARKRRFAYCCCDDVCRI